jgi:hypothetical protein
MSTEKLCSPDDRNYIACEELMQQVGAHKQQRAEGVYNLQ